MSDVAAAGQVVLLERQARDRGWWDQMRACYWPDSTVALSWYTGDGPGFVDASRAMAAAGNASVHRHVPPEELAPFRAPYALLGWLLAGRGYPVGADLLGDDQPDRTAAFYADTLRWLSG
ncbi:hypothetical protein AB0J72_31700 [Dactylosporangium sp. NPDC049742]|uniref:hypothetical protein n=1 Tax=Dactylosporangium sp. NPDC049742 TaxID=3154737 RepID=UPI00344AD797